MAIALPSVQSLLIQLRCNNNDLSKGTGFIMESKKGPVLITNRHNVTGRNNLTGEYLSPHAAIPDEVVIHHNSLLGTGRWVSTSEALLNEELPLWIEHPTLGAKADFVALPLTQLHEVKIFPYSNTGNPKIKIAPSEPASVVGFPFGKTGGGFFAIWATGFIATEPEINYDNLPVFLIDCRTRKGQSGSAVIAHRNGGMVTLEGGDTAAYNGPITRFLGIYSGRINDESDLGMVWKAAAIQELVDSI